MSDNLALKLLVAGIIGAVVGAAAAERYHFPTGLVYGGFNRSPTYRTRPIDPMLGSGRAADEGPRIVYGASPPVEVAPPPQEWEPQQPRYYYRRPEPRSAPRLPPTRTALCYREYENWNFGTSGRYYRCLPGSANRVYRGQRGDG
jgi:hypothetical protein